MVIYVAFILHAQNHFKGKLIQKNRIKEGLDMQGTLLLPNECLHISIERTIV